ncbi:MAG: hypothetical protein ACE5G2_12920 [Candidatus Krumholzibacteriia bacterium]
MRKAIEPLREEIAGLRAVHKELGAQLASPAPARPAAAAVTAPGGKHRAVVGKIQKKAGDGTSRSAPDDMPGCLVPDCPAPVLAKQLCESHYRIMRRTAAAGEVFDPAAQRAARIRATGKHCQEPGCSDVHYAKGLCRRHYMAARSRIRSAERRGPSAVTAPQVRSTTTEELEPEERPAKVQPVSHGGNGGHDAAVPLFSEPSAVSPPPNETLPTAEMVARVVAQYRGGLDRVAEVLGRNKRTLIDLLDRLDLMSYVTRVREAERQRVESATLRERLDDLLFREKLLEDLGCLKDVDDRARFEVRMRCADLAKSSETIEEVLQHLGKEFGLEEAGLKRLIWRYDLRRYLRGLKLKASPPPVRARI